MTFFCQRELFWGLICRRGDCFQYFVAVESQTGLVDPTATVPFRSWVPVAIVALISQVFFVDFCLCFRCDGFRNTCEELMWHPKTCWRELIRALQRIALACRCSNVVGSSMCFTGGSAEASLFLFLCIDLDASLVRSPLRSVDTSWWMRLLFGQELSRSNGRTWLTKDPLRKEKSARWSYFPRGPARL